MHSFISFLPYIWLQNILSKFWSLFFILCIFHVKFIVSYIIYFSYSKQTSFSDHKKFILFSFITFIRRIFVGRNMQILFEKLYETYLGSATQICSIQFIKHDLHIYAFFCLIINYYKLEYNSSLSSLLVLPAKKQHITCYK